MLFKRNDGQVFEAIEGTATHQLMSKSGEFEVIEETPENESDESNSEPNKSDVELTGEKAAAGSGGSKKRGGTGRRNKTDDPK